jgi:NAD(P)-dependent dehydrogenase (short-subunit alcohol dehydrogenase family)
VTSKKSVENLMRRTVAELDHLDILINSAALDPKFDIRGEQVTGEGDDPHSLKFEESPLDSWNQAIDVNLTGMFLCCQSAGRQMRSQGGGVIINVCSIYGLVGPDQRIYMREEKPPQFKPAYYSVTKAGVLGLTKYLATYYAGQNIRVNALTPGGVYNDHDDEFLEAYSSRTVMGRMADKDEMNGALLFLASDASSYMTGGNLVVDGGWTAW